MWQYFKSLPNKTEKRVPQSQSIKHKLRPNAGPYEVDQTKAYPNTRFRVQGNKDIDCKSKKSKSVMDIFFAVKGYQNNSKSL